MGLLNMSTISNQNVKNRFEDRVGEWKAHADPSVTCGVGGPPSLYGPLGRKYLAKDSEGSEDSSHMLEEPAKGFEACSLEPKRRFCGTKFSPTGLKVVRWGLKLLVHRN